MSGVPRIAGLIEWRNCPLQSTQEVLMSILWIVILVILVLALLGFLGRGRFYG